MSKEKKEAPTNPQKGSASNGSPGNPTPPTSEQAGVASAKDKEVAGKKGLPDKGKNPDTGFFGPNKT